jgi:predicted Fe-Mo cluster-binding NifX family protein
MIVIIMCRYREADGSGSGMVVRVAVPVTGEGLIGSRWGRAQRVAVAEIDGGAIGSWQEFDVGWDRLHDAGTEGAHHARVARFVREQDISMVIVEQMGDDMARMLQKLGLQVRRGVSGNARSAVGADRPR